MNELKLAATDIAATWQTVSGELRLADMLILASTIPQMFLHLPPEGIEVGANFLTTYYAVCLSTSLTFLVLQLRWGWQHLFGRFLIVCGLGVRFHAAMFGVSRTDISFVIAVLLIVAGIATLIFLNVSNDFLEVERQKKSLADQLNKSSRFRVVNLLGTGDVSISLTEIAASIADFGGLYLYALDFAVRPVEAAPEMNDLFPWNWADRIGHWIGLGAQVRMHAAAATERRMAEANSYSVVPAESATHFLVGCTFTGNEFLIIGCCKGLAHLTEVVDIVYEKGDALARHVLEVKEIRGTDLLALKATSDAFEFTCDFRNPAMASILVEASEKWNSFAHAVQASGFDQKGQGINPRKVNVRKKFRHSQHN